MYGHGAFLFSAGLHPAPDAARGVPVGPARARGPSDSMGGGDAATPDTRNARTAVADASASRRDTPLRERPGGRPGASGPGPSPTPPFLWAATLLALVGGFGLGGALFLHQAAWRFPAAQAHGHVQVFGWAGLLVLGVGLHFLPRLRGARLAA